MPIELQAEPLSAEKFSAFGDVIERKEIADKIINQGLCERHHDLARLNFGDGRAGISLFDAKPRFAPFRIDLVERHPDGSQAFVPLTNTPFLVVVADDDDGCPVDLRAFVTKPGQSVNILRNVWHGVLTPIGEPGQYIVVDRIGDGPNLEEYWFEDPVIVNI